MILYRSYREVEISSWFISVSSNSQVFKLLFNLKLIKKYIEIKLKACWN